MRHTGTIPAEATIVATSDQQATIHTDHTNRKVVREGPDLCLKAVVSWTRVEFILMYNFG